MKKQYITIKEVTEIMTPQEIANFMRNLFYYNDPIKASWYLTTRQDSIEDFLGGAFPWVETGEGYFYWESIMERSLVK